MFKPGEVARVKNSGLTVTVLSGTPEGSPLTWPIQTDAGVYDESQLSPAHPSVLATVEAKEQGFVERPSSACEEILPFDLRDKIERIIKGAKIDLRGHWKNGALLEGMLVGPSIFIHVTSMSTADAKAVLQANSAKVPLNRWVPIDVHLSNLPRTCSFCGAEDFYLETDGIGVRLATDPCPFEAGLPPTEWELNVPSGKLVIANDLRQIFPLPEAEDFSIDTAYGCKQTALAYAQHGMSHAFVGNTCPSVYQLGKGVYKISNAPSTEMWNGKKYVDIDPPLPFDGKQVAGICTDLWWYSICDQAEFKRRCKRFGVKQAEFNAEVINVKPGVYRFRHNDFVEQGGPGEVVYTQFEWVREPDPVKNYLESYEQVEVNPHAYVQAMTWRWPTLYGNGKKTVWENLQPEDRSRAWMLVTDSVLCLIGGGIKWHERGFPCAKVDASIPDVEPPAFRSQQHWYPFSRPYGGLFAPKLSPSFAKLAFRVLESVISFGTTVQDSFRSRAVQDVRDRMLVAVQRYRELAAEHPLEADPEYVNWLGQEGRAEAWVANFPLGPEFTEKHRKHKEKQRWVPEGTYAIAFDAREIEKGYFTCHPSKGGCWANKQDAERYAILGGESSGEKCFWRVHATNTSVPLYSIARVVNLGDVSHMGETIIEVAYDYGTPWMQGEVRKGIPEKEGGIKLLTKEEYDLLLPEAVQFFETAEKAARKKAKSS